MYFFIIIINLPLYISNVCIVQIMFGFADPCTLELNPGWPLRNYLLYVSYHWYVCLEGSIQYINY